MVKFNINQSWNDVNDTSFEPVPSGEYACEMIDSDVVPLKSSPDSRAMLFTAKIMEGEFQGRLIFVRFIILHHKKKAEAFGWLMYKKLCTSVNILEFPEDTRRLHGIPFMAYVAVEEGQAGYNAKNVIKKYSQYQHTVPAPAPAKKTDLSFIKSKAEEFSDDVPF